MEQDPELTKRMIARIEEVVATSEGRQHLVAGTAGAASEE